jgi:putative membrane protein
VLVRLALTWVMNVVALFVAAAIVPGVGYGDDAWALALAGLVLGLVNMVVRPLVILLALPAVILTLGVALLFVSALMLYLTDLIVPGFESGGFWSTLGGALVLWAVNVILQAVFKPDRPGPAARRFDFERSR